MADATYQPAVYKDTNGDRLVVANGGVLKIETGGTIVPNSGTQAATIADASAAAGANPTKAEFDALVTKFNTLLAALENVGILASS